MDEVQPLLDIVIGYYIEDRDSIQRFYRLNNDIENRIIQRECSSVVTRRIKEAENVERDLFYPHLYFGGLNKVIWDKSEYAQNNMDYKLLRRKGIGVGVSARCYPIFYYIMQEDDVYEWYVHNRIKDNQILDDWRDKDLYQDIFTILLIRDSHMTAIKQEFTITEYGLRKLK